MLSFNDYKVTVFGNSTLIPIIDADLEPNYTVGDLVIVQKGGLAYVKEGDEIFFYRTASGETTIHFATVTKAERVTDTESTFTVEGEYKFSSSNYIGEVDDAIVIPYVGKVLSVLQSKWGFLLLGVFPTLVAFLYTVYNVFVEIQEVKEEEKRAKKKKKKKKTSDSKNKTNSDVNSAENEVESKKENINEESKAELETEKEELLESKSTEKETVDGKNNQDADAIQEEEFFKIETTINIEREEISQDKNVQKENKEEKQEELTLEQKKKALIEAKMKSMTEEEKRALIEAKLKSMTPEEKKALIEAKKKKMEIEKNKKGE